MRGDPVKEWIIFSVCWLALLLPVLRVVGPQSERGDVAQLAAQQTSGVESRQAFAVVRYTGQPLFFRISQMSTVLYEENAPPVGGAERQIVLKLEDKILELLVEATWPDRQQHVFELELQPAGVAERRAHCWASQQLNEVVIFNWEDEL